MKIENNDDEKKQEKIDKLKNRIWKTWHARIKMEERLLKNAKYVDILSQIYTATLIVLSVYSLYENTRVINFITIVASILDMAFIFCASNMNYKDRAGKAKECYVELSNLYYAIDFNMTKEFNIEQYYERYNGIIGKFENHTERDYIKSLIEDENFNKLKYKNEETNDKKKYKKEVSTIKKIEYYIYKGFWRILLVLSVLLPIVLISWCIISLI